MFSLSYTGSVKIPARRNRAVLEAERIAIVYSTRALSVSVEISSWKSTCVQAPLASDALAETLPQAIGAAAESWMSIFTVAPADFISAIRRAYFWVARFTMNAFTLLT